MIEASHLTKDRQIHFCEKYTYLGYNDSQQRASFPVLIEGKARRCIFLSDNKKLFLKYQPISYIGLEDLLNNRVRRETIMFYPGASFVYLTLAEFLEFFQVHLNLTYNSIIYLSRQLRLHNNRGKEDEINPQVKTILDVGGAEVELEETLYHISFSDENDIPFEISEKLMEFYPANYTIMTEGDLTNELYIVIDGEVSVYKNIDNKPQLVITLPKNSLIGEMAQFDGQPRSATVITNTPVKALVFRPENFNMVFQLHPKWSLKIIYSLAERIENIRKIL